MFRVALPCVLALSLLACGGEPAGVAAQASTAAAVAAKVTPQSDVLSSDQHRAAIAEKDYVFNHLVGKERLQLTIYTPYTRIVEASQAAQEHYKGFTEGDVTAEMLRPEVEIASMIGGAETIIIKPSKQLEQRPIFQPTHFERESEVGSIATFPLEALADGRTIHVVYSGLVPHHFCKDPGPTPNTVECAIPIDMTKIR